MKPLVFLTQRQLTRFLAFVLFAAVAVEAATAQSVPGTAGIAGTQPQSRPASICSEPSDPRAVHADVNLCVDRLVKADVQDVPGVGLDLNVFPYNDPEMLSTPQENLSAPQPKVSSITSWGPQPGFTSWGPRPANADESQPESNGSAPEATPSPALQLWEASLLADTTVTQDQPSPEPDLASELQWKLKPARARKTEDVQDVAGVRLDSSAFPYNDPEMLSTPQESLSAPQPKVSSITSWGPQPGFTSWGPRPANADGSQPESNGPAPEATPSPALQLWEASLLADTTVTQDQPSPDPGPASELQRKLKPARARKEAEDKRRQSRELQKRFDAQCRQLHLSDLECRLKLRSDPLAAITDRTKSWRSCHRKAITKVITNERGP